MKNRLILCVLVAAATAATIGAVPLVPQQSSSDWCRDERWDDERQGVCEVREFTVAAASDGLNVDAAPNGGISVEGGPRSDINIQAKVMATAATEERARQIASGVRVEATAQRVSADGPRGLPRGESWYVSYRLAVPTQSSLSLRTTNGGISIRDVEGRVQFKTVNGGVKLSGMAGDVRGTTSNGGVDVELDGATWQGEGLDVETSNGGVRLRIPENYSAHLETGTVNGGFNIDFPITVQGRLDRQVSADIGAGGPTIRVRTHNGGVKVTKR